MGGSRRGGGAVARQKKQELRAAALRRRLSRPRGELAALSKHVEGNLLSLQEYKDAKLLISYCAKDDEVQTKHIIERALADGKRVAVIATDVPSKTLSFHEIKSFADDLVPGAFGILEPKPGKTAHVPLEKAEDRKS